MGMTELGTVVLREFRIALVGRTRAILVIGFGTAGTAFWPGRLENVGH